jgi:hypothetical protein
VNAPELASGRGRIVRQPDDRAVGRIDGEEIRVEVLPISERKEDLARLTCVGGAGGGNETGEQGRGGSEEKDPPSD